MHITWVPLCPATVASTALPGRLLLARLGNSPRVMPTQLTALLELFFVSGPARTQSRSWPCHPDHPERIAGRALLCNPMEHLVCRNHKEFRRLILRYGTNGAAESLRLEVFAPQNLERHFSGVQRKSLDIRSQRSQRPMVPDAGRPVAPIAPI